MTTTLPEMSPQAVHTRARVTFYTWEDNGFTGLADEAAREEIGSVYGVTTNKTFGPASGTFTITLKKPETKSEFDYDTVWRDPENVWVLIQFTIDGSNVDAMLGLIDTVTGSVDRSGLGVRDETYQIHGRDFGKVFEQTKTYLNPFLQKHIGDYSLLFDQLRPISFTGGTPDQFVRGIVTAWIGNDDRVAQPWELPPGLSAPNLETFYRYLDLRNLQKMGAESGEISAPMMTAIDQQDGKPLWDCLQQYCNGLLNELWCDLAPWASSPERLDNQRPSLFLRERPFPTKQGNSTWAELPTYDLERRHVRSAQLTKGGAPLRYNYWMVTPSGYQGPSFAALIARGALNDTTQDKPGTLPIINRMSLRRHGLRQFIKTSNFFPSKEATTITIQQLAANWTRKLHDWHAAGHLYLTGSIKTSRVFPEIRVGTRVRQKLSEAARLFYVEGVSHQWNYPGTGTTTLTVTRGEYDADDLLQFIYDELETTPSPLTADGAKLPDEAKLQKMVADLLDGERFTSERAAEGSIDTRPLSEQLQATLQEALDNDQPFPEE